MPFRILDLPNELICEIIQVLPFKTIFTIQRVNHHFHALAQGLLYKKLGDLTSDNRGGTCLTSWDALELLRVFDKEPHFVGRVQSMYINWDWGFGCTSIYELSRRWEETAATADLAIWARETKALGVTGGQFPSIPYPESEDHVHLEDWPVEFADAALPLLLTKLMNLEVLECTGFTHDAFCFPFMWQTFKKPVFQNLRTLIWTEDDGILPGFPVVYIIPMMMVAPTLERISTTGGFGSMGANDDAGPIFFLDGRPGQMLLDRLVVPGFQCNITSLEFNMANIQPKLFRWLLRHTKMLQRFKYTACAEASPPGILSGFVHRVILEDMMEALKQVQHTLRVLHLDVGLRRRGYVPNEMVEDLAVQFESFEEFYQLRSMTVNFYQMVPLNTILTPEVEPTLLDRLPPNLEYFAFADGVGEENIRKLYNATVGEYYEEITKHMLQVLHAKMEGEMMQSLESVVTPVPPDVDSRRKLVEACSTGDVTCKFWDAAQEF